MKKALCLLLLLCLLPLAGCAQGAEEKAVIASFYPVYVLAQNVLAGVPGVRLTSLTAPTTGCLHDYQLLTGDMRALAGAAALLINGAGMEAFLPDVTAQFPALPVVDCAAGVSLIAEDEEGHGLAGKAHNAHIWLAPKNAMQMVRNLESGLAALLPESAALIHENAAAYLARLSALDEELSAAIAALPRKDIVTFHEAFPYFAQAYGLNVVAVVALEPDEPISPRMLAQVVQAVKDAGCPPLFAEPQYDGAALQAVSQETGAPVFSLDPLATGNGAATAYEDVMRENLQVLQAALGAE